MPLHAPVLGQRYVRFTDHLRRMFGCRVHKVSIDAGFTCPNRDGTVAVGGCIYCNNASFSPGNRRLSVTAQLEQGKRFLRQRYGAQKFIAYFQAYTNTYGDVQVLQSLYDEALACEDIVGLAIGTRPDCVPEAVLDLLADYAAHTYLWLELGLESGYDYTDSLGSHQVTCWRPYGISQPSVSMPSSCTTCTSCVTPYSRSCIIRGKCLSSALKTMPHWWSIAWRSCLQR